MSDQAQAPREGEDDHNPSGSEEVALIEQMPARLPTLFAELGIRHQNLALLAKGTKYLVYQFTNASDSSKNVIRVAIRPSDDKFSKSSFHRYPNMTDHAAVLKWLEKTFKDEFPGVFSTVSHYDATNENQAERPYMIQSFIEGEEVNYDKQSTSKKFEMVRLYAELTTLQETVRSKLSGKIQARPEYAPKGGPDSGLSKSVAINSFKKSDAVLRMSWDPDTTIRDWLYQTIDHHAQQDRLAGYCPMPWRQLRGMVHQMEVEGYFSDPEGKQVMSKAVLCHGQLQYDKVVFKHNKRGKLRVAGIIGWDEAQAAPLALAREPPYFLWEPVCLTDHASLEDWNQDCDYLPDRCWSCMSYQDCKIKSAWDQYQRARDPTYMDDAYGRGLWIRRVAKLAMYGLVYKNDHETLDWLLDEWESHLWGPIPASDPPPESRSESPDAGNAIPVANPEPADKSWGSDIADVDSNSSLDSLSDSPYPDDSPNETNLEPSGESRKRNAPDEDISSRDPRKKRKLTEQPHKKRKMDDGEPIEEPRDTQKAAAQDPISEPYNTRNTGYSAPNETSSKKRKAGHIQLTEQPHKKRKVEHTSDPTEEPRKEHTSDRDEPTEEQQQALHPSYDDLCNCPTGQIVSRLKDVIKKMSNSSAPGTQKDNERADADHETGELKQGDPTEHEREPKNEPAENSRKKRKREDDEPTRKEDSSNEEASERPRKKSKRKTDGEKTRECPPRAAKQPS